MVGRGITEGLVPYRDFFDLKGPYFFFVQALGQLLHRDRLGVYLIQIPFLWASLILIRKLCRLYLSKGKTIAVLFIFLATHISILWGGNTLEEYMLPVNLLVVYLTIRYLKDHTLKEHSIPPYLPLVTGLCFGIILFAKITVAAPIMGICAAIGLSLLAYRKYKELFLFILYFILGVFIAAVPVFLYYAYHDCLLTMLYCVFEFAYLRSVDFSDPFTIKWELKLAACFFGFFVAIFHFPLSKSMLAPRKTISDHPVESEGEALVASEEPEYSLRYGFLRAGQWLKKKNTDQKHPTIPIEICLILLFMSLITYILLHLGNPWIYYFMTTEPILILALIMFLYVYQPLILFSSVREALCLAALAVYIFYFGYCTMDTVQIFLYDHTNPYYEEYYQNAKNIALLIPESERDSVFSFDIDMTFFEATQIMPCYKYQINLQFFIALNPAIRDEIMEYFDKTPPKWMIISETLDQYLPEMYDMMMEKYRCLYYNSAGCLYVRND